FMLNEYEEFVYHEMIAHIPLFAHPAPKKALVIGGGDGGTVREILKHKSIKQVDFVEIDKMVFDVSKRFFKKLTSWKKDKRVNFFFEDGCRFIKDKENYYDVIIIDSTDPVDIGKVLFTKGFYADVKKALTKNGIMTAQTEDPFYSGDILRKTNKRIQSVFGKNRTHLYLAFVPTYPSGCWSFAFASKTNDIKIKNRAAGIKTKYYNKNVHLASFCLPNFVKELVE
ncbi:MAG: polyamine aminopropyltransferase, partial [bacterium]